MRSGVAESKLGKSDARLVHVTARNCTPSCLAISDSCWHTGDTVPH